MSDWVIVLPAFVFSLLLVLTHTYLGLHVLARGIIFVDLALAQVAALGASIAFLLGQDAHGVTAQAFAFAATLSAALGFTLLRRIPGKTAREVVIGCVYVVATALAILVLSRSAQGMEELKALFNGSILWVRWSEIAVVSAVYLVLAVLHARFQGRFAALSATSDAAAQLPMLWEFAFFASFAIVITLAVNIAGVLVVFAFLIIPAFSASLLAQPPLRRLVTGWAIGASGSMIGLWAAYAGDLPVGPTVVSVLGVMPVLASLLRFWITPLRTRSWDGRPNSSADPAHLASKLPTPAGRTLGKGH